MHIHSFHRMTRLSCLVGVVLVVLVLVGCGPWRARTYSGPEIEDSKLAVLRGERLPVGQGGVGIERVDGKRTASLFIQLLLAGLASANEVSILPGKHNITARFSDGIYSAWADLWLVAEPGERYIVKIKVYYDRSRVRMWIENERTGQPTGGITGSDDEPKQN